MPAGRKSSFRPCRDGLIKRCLSRDVGCILGVEIGWPLPSHRFCPGRGPSAQKSGNQSGRSSHPVAASARIQVSLKPGTRLYVDLAQDRAVIFPELDSAQRITRSFVLQCKDLVFSTGQGSGRRRCAEAVGLPLRRCSGHLQRGQPDIGRKQVSTNPRGVATGMGNHALARLTLAIRSTFAPRDPAISSCQAGPASAGDEPAAQRPAGLHCHCHDVREEYDAVRPPALFMVDDSVRSHPDAARCYAVAADARAMIGGFERLSLQANG